MDLSKLRKPLWEMSYWHFLSLIFVVAKLTGHFPYTWYWVFFPIIFYGSLALTIKMLDDFSAWLKKKNKQQKQKTEIDRQLKYKKTAV